MKKDLLLFFLLFSFLGEAQVQLLVLGTAQDAGAPQINCLKSCCVSRWATGEKEPVVALGLIDQRNNTHYLFEATPDVGQQLYALSSEEKTEHLGGVFLTHAHMGHYSGLLYFGKEAMGARKVLVNAFPRMVHFLKSNGPWEQLVSEQNIQLNVLNESSMRLADQLSVIPFKVPHRDEYSETAGYEIIGPNKKAIFIPDIDKWERWETPIEEVIKRVDFAFIDATFFDGNELPNRDMNAIPHPFVIESLERFKSLSALDKKKIYFIHFNHTNPLLNEHSTAAMQVKKAGFNIARKGLKVDL